ncbi:MAG TPA: GNAT family N-acetyltransferase [Clostridium sp.]|nr:GNAT family N-acetyltransferase [Clostridium sp.]
MNRIELVQVCEKYKREIIDYKREFEINNDSLHGTACIQNYENFESWLKKVQEHLKEETITDGFVPATTYMAIRKEDGRLIGMIDIRHRLNDYLFHFGGNIGYSIRRSERRKGYATEMLKLALEKCREINMDKVLITCDKENIGSAKTILNNGGILENEVPEDGRVTQRYWISV